MTSAVDDVVAKFQHFLGMSDSTVNRRRALPRNALGKEFWDQQFKRVSDWLSWERDYEVECFPGAHDRVLLGGVNVIEINSSRHPETKFYALLHEAGHILVREDWQNFAIDHPNYLEHPDVAPDGRRTKSKSYRIGLLSEEMAAWKRGRQLAMSLDLFVDPYKYDSEVNNAILSYVQWCSNVSRSHAAAIETRVARHHRPHRPRPRRRVRKRRRKK